MANDTNEQKIREFNARAAKQQQSASGGQQAPPIQTVTPVTSPTASMSVGDIQLLMADPTTLSQDQLLRRDALSTKENLKKADEEKRRLEQQERQLALKERNARKVLLTEGQRLTTNALDAPTPIGRWLENRPKPGGIATLIIIIVIFLLAIVPVNSEGDTRLKLIWLTITGKTHIDYSKTGNATADSSQQSFQTNINSLPASQQPSFTPPPPAQQGQPTIQPLGNYNANMGNVVSGMFGLTDL